MGRIMEGGSVISPELTLDSPEKWVQKFPNLEDYVNGLHDEMKKIEAFKRELPLCMLLVKNEIARLKKEIIPWKPIDPEPSVQTLNKCKDERNSDDCDKTKWMSSVQIWSSGSGKKDLPFFAYEEAPLLFLGVSETKNENNSSKSSSGTSSPTESSKLNPKAARKQRRCWSSELHRRFINALQQLGGAHAATPKHIRELMQVDDLTNDEVKSHLQKYRLHTRRASQIHISTSSILQVPPFSNHKQEKEEEDDEEEDDDDSAEIHNH